MNARLILPAAGFGRRLGSQGPKALIPLRGEPLLIHALRAFAPLGMLEGAIIAIPPGGFHTPFNAALAQAFPGIPFRLVEGGKERQVSVQNALQALEPGDDIVAIHDAARPFIQTQTIRDALDAAREHGAATVAIPAIDTILAADADGMLEDTPDRSRLWACQTPQTFRVEVIRDAHRRAAEHGWNVTDDATLAKRAGATVKLVLGSPANIKITTPHDLRAAEALLGAATMYRTGHGYDLHRLEPGRKFILGGVLIPHEKGLLGHSDADALAHAVTDALFGAAALGDIGTHFPDTSPLYKDADSMHLLRQAVHLVQEAGFRIINADATIIAQRPKLAPYIEDIRANLANVLEIPLQNISVKAKTNEGMGPEGHCEAISVHAVATLAFQG